MHFNHLIFIRVCGHFKKFLYHRIVHSNICNPTDPDTSQFLWWDTQLLILMRTKIKFLYVTNCIFCKSSLIFWNRWWTEVDFQLSFCALVSWAPAPHFMCQESHLSSSTEAQKLKWRPSKWQARTPSCPMNITRCLSAYPRMELLSTSLKILVRIKKNWNVKKVIKKINWLLGEVLRGDRIVNTPYDVRMAENVPCKLLCHSSGNPMTWGDESSQAVISRIQHEYYVHL